MARVASTQQAARSFLQNLLHHNSFGHQILVHLEISEISKFGLKTMLDKIVHLQTQ